MKTTMAFRFINAALWGMFFGIIITHSVLTWDTEHELFWSEFIRIHLLFLFLCACFAYIVDKAIREISARIAQRNFLNSFIQRIRRESND